MIVSLKTKGKEFFFKIKLEKSDKKKGIGQGGKEISLIGDKFSLEFPYKIKTVHPDLYAATVLTVVQPFVGKQITFPEAVSEDFAKTVERIFGFKVVNIDKSLRPRKPGKVNSLSFSGGMDSTATSLLLPEGTVHLMFARKEHPTLKANTGNYNPDIVLRVLKEFPNAYAMKSDLEYVIGPFPQFSSWVGLAVQCILSADHFDLQNVNFGTIMGSAYTKEGRYYKRKPPKADDGWQGIFSAIGLPISKPVSGLTEIGTSTLVYHSKYRDIACSCPFGEYQKPCMKCTKCFRKTLAMSGALNEPISEELLDHFMLQKPIRDYIAQMPPIYFQHILMYGVSKSDFSKHMLMQRFKDKILYGGLDPSWCGYLYEDGLEQVYPVSLRKSVRKNIVEYMKPMPAKELKVMKKWNLEVHFSKPEINAEVEKINCQIISMCNRIEKPITWKTFIPWPIGVAISRGRYYLLRK